MDKKKVDEFLAVCAIVIALLFCLAALCRGSVERVEYGIDGAGQSDDPSADDCQRLD
jgi:hypothetical protein